MALRIPSSTNGRARPRSHARLAFIRRQSHMKQTQSNADDTIATASPLGRCSIKSAIEYLPTHYVRLGAALEFIQMEPIVALPAFQATHDARRGTWRRRSRTD